MTKKLEGKTAVITGGTEGIGLATAKLFVKEGAYVFITGRRQKELDEAVKAIGANVSGVQGDVAQLADLDRLYETVSRVNRRIDIVFANAGAGEFVPFGAVTEEHFDKLFNINVKGTLFTVQKALPLLNDGGSIILNGSVASVKGTAAFGVYAAPTQGQSDTGRSKAGRTTQKTPLRWDVFLAPSIPAITSDLPPGEKQRPWPPISSTLISGERDAVLVDTPITIEQARALANWVAASGKNLTTIYATHGHGDHFFGTSTVLERFPGARFVARPDAIKIMRQQASPESLATFWNPRFPGQISSHLAIAEELSGNVINLEGHDLVSVPLGFTDTANTTCLHVPSIGLIVAGDAAYNGVHLHLSESPDQQKRQEWIAALDKMDSLKPRAVIAGHKRVGNDDSPKILGETRRYIRDFERLAMQTTTALELYDQMLKLYPDWGNRGAL